jgi:polyisoprenyl-phosphate glycosyltransferase
VALISIVVPVYNNAASLHDLIVKLNSIATQNPEDQFEYIFVDDGSRDESYSILQIEIYEDPRLRVVKLSRNFGSNAAILAGLGQARGQAIAAIAADLQDPPELIDDMLSLWREGNKVILAARQSRDDGWLNDRISDAFYTLFRRFAIKSMPKRGFDFFLIDRQVCDIINAIQENNTYLMGLILWLGFTPKTIYYHRSPRIENYGRSMWTLSKKMKYFIDSFVSFSYFPIRVASLTGFLVSAVGLIYAFVIVFLRLVHGIAVEGWSSLMVILMVVSGVQMMMIGILGEYLWRNLDETRKRPRFIIEKTLENYAKADPNSAKRNNN